MGVKAFFQNLIKPASDAYQKRTDRKIAQDSAKAKLALSKTDNDFKLEMTDAEWEALAVSGLGESWKDEYVTVSLVSIINLVVVGGLLAAFGYPQMLEGLVIAIQTLVEVGVDLGFLITTVVFAAVGLKMWRSA